MGDSESGLPLIKARRFFIRRHKQIFHTIIFSTALFVIFIIAFNLVSIYDTVPAEHVHSYHAKKVITYIDGAVEESFNENEEDSFEEYLKESSSTHLPPEHETKCHLPKLKPFDDSILEFIEQPDPIICPREEFPLLFNKTFHSHLILVDNPMKYGYVNCFYRYFVRESEDDDSIVFSEETFPLVEMRNPIPPEHEFIAINCTKGNESKIIDMFPFVPFKFEAKDEPHLKDNFNVVVLGLDALSHMNFIRTMPKSYKFIKDTMDAYGMNGYTKIGDNTFPNVAAALMGLDLPQIEDWRNTQEDQHFDNCPFIWKDFSALGYATSFVEDAAWMSAFNYGKNGFLNPPTDYYTRPFFYSSDEIIGTEKLSNAYLCNGPRLTFEVILDYVQQTAITMQNNKKKYFQFVWATSLFHDILNEGMLGDQALLDTLNMFGRNNYFSNTIFIITSDHGARWGDIRSTYQGKIEERMPLLYFMLPESLKTNPQYSAALENLEKNKDRLTTPYDLHETLKEFLNMENMQNERLAVRVEKLNNSETKPRGISLLLPIPLERDCESAEIEEHWCVCHLMKTVTIQNNSDVYEAAQGAVAQINQILMEGGKQCAYLSLSKIIAAQEMTLNTTALEDDKSEEKEEKPASEANEEQGETPQEEEATNNEENNEQSNDKNGEQMENKEINDNHEEENNQNNNDNHEEENQNNNDNHEEENKQNNNDNHEEENNQNNNDNHEEENNQNNNDNHEEENNQNNNDNHEEENNQNINEQNNVQQAENESNKEEAGNNEDNNNQNPEQRVEEESANYDKGNENNENMEIMQNLKNNQNDGNNNENEQNQEIPVVEEIQSNEKSLMQMKMQEWKRNGIENHRKARSADENNNEENRVENVEINEINENNNEPNGNPEEHDRKIEEEANQNDEKEIDKENGGMEIDKENDGKEIDKENNEKEIGKENDKKEIDKENDGIEIDKENNEKEIGNENDEKEIDKENDGIEIDKENDEKEIDKENDEKEIDKENDEKEIDKENDEKEADKEKDEKEIDKEKDENADAEPRLPELIFTLNFVTTPGNASFEATVKRFYTGRGYQWNILGDISRTNLYGNQSSCVESYKLKKFCYCK